MFLSSVVVRLGRKPELEKGGKVECDVRVRTTIRNECLGSLSSRKASEELLVRDEITRISEWPTVMVLTSSNKPLENEHLKDISKSLLEYESLDCEEIWNHLTVERCYVGDTSLYFWKKEELEFRFLSKPADNTTIVMDEALDFVVYPATYQELFTHHIYPQEFSQTTPNMMTCWQRGMKAEITTPPHPMTSFEGRSSDISTIWQTESIQTFPYSLARQQSPHCFRQNAVYLLLIVFFLIMCPLRILHSSIKRK